LRGALQISDSRGQRPQIEPTHFASTEAAP